MKLPNFIRDSIGQMFKCPTEQRLSVLSGNSVCLLIHGVIGLPCSPNQWIAESGVRVLNVETVVLPNVNGVEEASDVGIRTSGEMSSYWYQVVRVWYQGESPDR